MYNFTGYLPWSKSNIEVTINKITSASEHSMLINMYYEDACYELLKLSEKHFITTFTYSDMSSLFGSGFIEKYFKDEEELREYILSIKDEYILIYNIRKNNKYKISFSFLSQETNNPTINAFMRQMLLTEIISDL